MRKQFNKVQKLVYSMLIENTGKHFLDSGGTDGRGWQRNGKKSILNFYNEPAESYFYNDGYKYADLERTVSVFHYLSNLELDSICDKFNKLNKGAENWDGDFYGVSIKAQSYLYNLAQSHNVEYINMGWNTYNGDSDLSQTLQGGNFTIDGDEYVLIQIHNGADVRGGYTDAKLFKVTDSFYYIREYMDKYELLDELEYITVIGNDGNEVDKKTILNYLNS